MSWTCHCGDQHNDDELLCPICGMKVTVVLVLTGTAGKRKFSQTPQPVFLGNSVYTSLAGAADAARVSAKQLFLEKQSGDEWYLTAVPKTVNATTVNDVLCNDGTPVKLQSGDVIKIASRADVSQNCAPLTVSFEIRP